MILDGGIQQARSTDFLRGEQLARGRLHCDLRSGAVGLYRWYRRNDTLQAGKKHHSGSAVSAVPTKRGFKHPDNTPTMITLTRPTNRWPTTVPEAVDLLLSTLTDAEKVAIRAIPPDDPPDLHFSLGAAIRNDFRLWDGNTALLASCGSPEMHPDTAAMVIVRAVWKRLRGG